MKTALLLGVADALPGIGFILGIGIGYTYIKIKEMIDEKRKQKKIMELKKSSRW